MAEGIAARLTKLFQMGLYIPSGIYENGLQMATRLEWDENKNRANRAKHAIAFETAALVFEDPNLITRQDREVEGEQRWQTIGYAKGVLTVAHTAQASGADEVIRIVSARRATRGERKLYEEETGA